MKKGIYFFISIFILSFVIYLISCDTQVTEPNKVINKTLTDANGNCDNEDDYYCQGAICEYTGSCDCEHFCMYCYGDLPPTGTPGIVTLQGYDDNCLQQGSIWWECEYSVAYSSNGWGLGNRFPFGTFYVCMYFTDPSTGDSWTGSRTIHFYHHATDDRGITLIATFR